MRGKSGILSNLYAKLLELDFISFDCGYIAKVPMETVVNIWESKGGVKC